jgi:signal transduction histidine kinase
VVPVAYGRSVQGALVWLRRRPMLVDAGLALLVMAAWLAMAGGLRTAQAPFGLAICAALVLRRAYPAAVWLWICAVGVAQLVVGVPPGLYAFAVAVAFYTVVAYGPGWARLLVPPAALVAAGLTAARWMPPGVPLPDRLNALLALASPLVIAWVAGEYNRTRRAYFEQLEERAERAERERDTRARMAVAEERARIARELHDVVAHNVSVIVIQSDGAASALDEGDAAAARGAVQAIGATGRTALGEMRRLLGVLGTEAAESYAPLPGIDDLEALVERVRTAGLPVKLEVDGEPRELSQGRALAVYRIVQESLTNTLKHAGAGASALVRIGYEPRTLAVQVEDDGHGPATDGAPAGDRPAGHGLVGMRERAAMFGGTLHAGPRRPHGFVVLAQLPWGAE